MIITMCFYSSHEVTSECTEELKPYFPTSLSETEKEIKFIQADRYALEEYLLRRDIAYRKEYDAQGNIVIYAREDDDDWYTFKIDPKTNKCMNS